MNKHQKNSKKLIHSSSTTNINDAVQNENHRPAIPQRIKDFIYDKQRGECANRPGKNLRGLENHECLLWLKKGETRGKLNDDTLKYEFDHIIEYSLCKSNNIDNLQALCKHCHMTKTRNFMKNRAIKIPLENVEKEFLELPDGTTTIDERTDVLNVIRENNIFNDKVLNDCIYSILRFNNSNATSYEKLLYYLYKKIYMCDTENNWYRFNGNNWTNIGKINVDLYKDAQREILLMCIYLWNFCKHTAIEKRSFHILGKNIKSVIELMAKPDTMRELMGRTEEEFQVFNNVSFEFDNNNKLICFNNGIYNLNSHTLRKGTTSDMILQNINFQYRNKHTYKYDKLLNFLKNTIPNKKERDFLVAYIGCSLNGDKCDELVILHGENTGNKMKFIQLMTRTLGDYIGSIDSSHFIDVSNFTDDSNVFAQRKKRILYSVEKNRKNKFPISQYGTKWITKRRYTFSEYCSEIQPGILYICDKIPTMKDDWPKYNVNHYYINFPEQNDNDQNIDDLEIDEDVALDFILLLLENNKIYNITDTKWYPGYEVVSKIPE